MKIKPLKRNLKKVTNTVGAFLKVGSNGSSFKKRLTIYKPTVSKSVQVSATQEASEKVASTVATFYLTTWKVCVLSE